MRGSAVSEGAIKVNTNDLSITSRLSPEYVLKVELPEDKVDSKSVSPIDNPNPENLPAVRKGINAFLRKTIVMSLLFIFAFLFSVLVGFNIVFIVFEI